MELTQQDHEAIRNLVGDIASHAEGLDRAARELPLLLRSSKLATVLNEADAMSGLSEALRLAIKLKRPAAELFQASSELSVRFQALNHLVSTTRATSPAKSAVALAARIAHALTSNLKRWADIEGALLAAPEVLVARPEPTPLVGT